MTDRLISCDDHMDLSQLPADLWTTRLPASLLDRAPHVEERDGQAVWVCDGKVWGRWDGKPPATGSARPIKALYNAFDRAGIHDASARRPPWDPTEKGLYVDYPLEMLTARPLNRALGRVVAT